jgi:hypothetical protein
MIGEITEWTILIHDKAGWHVRFKKAEGYSNLRPTISSAKATGILFIILLIYVPFVAPGLFINDSVMYLLSLTKYWGLLFFLSITFSFLWIWHHIVGTKWNLRQSILAAISIVMFTAYVLLNIFTFG